MKHENKQKKVTNPKRLYENKNKSIKIHEEILFSFVFIVFMIKCVNKEKIDYAIIGYFNNKQ